MRVTFLLFDGFSNLVLACLLEPLRAVRDEAGVEVAWHILTASGGTARSSSGMQVAPDARGPGPVDVLVVVAGYGYRDHATGPGLRLLTDMVRHSDLVIGADSGAWLLAAAGLLDGREATLHWSLVPDFAETFPQVSTVTASYVRGERLWTCGGASGAFEMVQALIAARFGQDQAYAASSMFVHHAPAPDADAVHGLPLIAASGSPGLRRVIDRMVETIETPLPLAQLAATAGMSPSKLDRMFRAVVGLPPGAYYRALRLARARELRASTTLPLREIALRCGYGDASALSKALRRARDDG